MRPLELAGQMFNHLKAIERTMENKRSGWTCECVCGKRLFVPTFRLTSGAIKSCGCMAYSKWDLVGKRFGMLVVTERVGTQSTAPLYRCTCDCGGEKTTESQYLNKGITTHCGCMKHENHSKANRGEYGVSIRKRVLDTYKKNANTRDYVFEISDERAHQLFEGDCTYCGEPPSTVATRKHMYGSFTYNGIDRINNEIGYVEGNVQSCCAKCNIGKGSMTHTDYIEHCKKIARRFS